jgi:hypothetical protein
MFASMRLSRRRDVRTVAKLVRALTILDEQARAVRPDRTRRTIRVSIGA